VIFNLFSYSILHSLIFICDRLQLFLGLFAISSVVYKRVRHPILVYMELLEITDLRLSQVNMMAA